MAGKPGQLELERERQLERRGQALEIPRTPPDPIREPRPEKRAEQARNDWQAQERAARARGALWQSGQLRSWESFARGRGRRDPQTLVGSVEIDAGRIASGKTAAPKPREPSGRGDTRGWKQIKAAHVAAATFQERAEDALKPFLGNRKGRSRG